MDPFGIVGVASLAIELTRIIKEYASSLTRSSKTIKALISEVATLTGALQELRIFLNTQKPHFHDTAVIKQASLACNATLVDIHKNLAPFCNGSKGGKMARRLLWPFKEDDIRLLIVDIHRYTSTFQFGLTLQGFQLLSKSANEVSNALKIQIKQLQDTETLVTSLSTVELAVDNLARDVHHLRDGREADLMALKKQVIIDRYKTIDPIHSYNAARQKHVKGTGGWLLDSPKYNEWVKQSNSLLWLHGIAGCGKTVLSSSVIAQLLDDEKPAVAYFFFDFNDSSSQTALAFVNSCVGQLCERCAIDRIPHKNIPPKEKASGSLEKSLAVLKEFVSVFSAVFIVVDALDECREQEDLSLALKSIQSWNYGYVHMFVASRWYQESAKLYDGLTSIQLCIEGQGQGGDVQAYVDHRLCRGNLNMWPPDLKRSIKDRIIRSTGNNFQWAAVQLDSLDVCVSRKDVGMVMDKVPQSLSESYEQILEGMKPHTLDMAMTALEWLAYADWPLTIEVMAEILMVSTSSPREYRPEDRLMSDPCYVLTICSSLITLHAHGSTRFVRLAHFTVKEHINTLCTRKEVKMRMAECCLALFQHLQQINREETKLLSGLPKSLEWYLLHTDWYKDLAQPALGRLKVEIDETADSVPSEIKAVHQNVIQFLDPRPIKRSRVAPDENTAPLVRTKSFMDEKVEVSTRAQRSTAPHPSRLPSWSEED